MNALHSSNTIPTAALSELSDYLRTAGSTLTTTEAVVHALRLWIAAQREPAVPLRGYQWKCLFLPDGTHVRMSYDGTSYYANVAGDELVYQGQPVSPRQMTLAIAGDGHNAWRDLWIRRPGEKNWQSAWRLRRELESSASTQPATPTSQLEAVTAAAKTMSTALQTALLLVEHIDHHAQDHYERRVPKHRRKEDEMIDDCKFD